LTDRPEGPDRPDVDEQPLPGELTPGDSAPQHSAKGPATFSLEGRAAPALYLLGWVGSVSGFAAIEISFLAAGSAGARWVFLGGLFALAVGLFAYAGSQAVERSRRTDLAYRGPSPVLTFLAVTAATVLLVIVVLGPLSALGLDARSPAATTLSLLITTLVYVAIVRLLVVDSGALSWREMGLGQSGAAAGREIAIGAVLALPVLGVTLALGALLSRVLAPPSSPLPPSGDAAGLVLNLLTAAILAPVGEELFFRGFTTTAWARTRGARVAIVQGAVFFALAHVATLFDASFADGAQRALYSFLALLPVSVALGWVFLARRSLYASIGLHATFNLIQVVLVFVAVSAGQAG
jgi:membrane protease YdiL (CAAX protease family)